TRGDGSKGEEITTNVKQLRSIPLSAAFSKHGIHKIEIRGEVLINKHVFKQVNEQRVAQAQPPFANPRNAASGGLRMQDPKEVAQRRMEAFLYHVSYAEDKAGNNLLLNDDASHFGFIQLLHQLGFVTPTKDLSLCATIEEVIDACNAFEAERNDYPFEMDGLVVKVSSLRQQQLCGYTSHHPRWAMAYKFKAQQGTSKLINVEFQVGRTGNITPVAKIEPVQLTGVTVTSVSMFNEDFIRDKDIRLGDTVLVERAGDVIPYIVMPIVEGRSGDEKQIHFPKQCPSCGSDLVKLEDEAATRCINLTCPAQVLERLVHFVSKDAMNVKGFSIASINEFLELGLLKDIPDIYELDYDKILQLEGWKEKSVSNLKQSIEGSKRQPLNRLIFGLGIRMVGETTAKKITERVGDIFELKNWSVEQLTQIEDVGPKVAQSIFDFFQNDDNLAMLEKLKRLGVNTLNNEPLKKEGILSGKTFLFTGTLSMKRSDAEETVERLGGKILGSVSAKLNYLVAGEDAGSKLEKARKIGTVEVIDEAAFLKMVESGG
ncbi:MAG TPA: NAD-dependent DNA ligase LigA, partial [Chitinophagales bacterium]|nr:NAD-dependent DNA ligase LigA [Chitinophagales bacterium]